MVTDPSVIDIRRYASRIKYLGEARPTLEVLFSLQESHLLSVPFENLDIHAGRRIALGERALFEKVVLRKRGGFCYELNGLFHFLLKIVGFNVKLLMGRVYDHNRNSYGPEFDHMLILAEVDGVQWIVDIGFGDFSLHPLRFVLNQPLSDRNGEFVIDQFDDEYFRVSRYLPEERRSSPEYLFSLQERTLGDFSDMCQYHQTSPDSHFTSQRICSMATANGRITLTDHKLIVTEGKTRKEIIIRDQSDFSEALARYFNIVQL
ncbi:MAG: acetyltransferase [Nitrospiraceae bacterium]|nr:MAG: acetyltransferase [Nitrospiraceae bacterium]